MNKLAVGEGKGQSEESQNIEDEEEDDPEETFGIKERGLASSSNSPLPSH